MRNLEAVLSQETIGLGSLGNAKTETAQGERALNTDDIKP